MKMTNSSLSSDMEEIKTALGVIMPLLIQMCSRQDRFENVVTTRFCEDVQRQIYCALEKARLEPPCKCDKADDQDFEKGFPARQYTGYYGAVHKNWSLGAVDLAYGSAPYFLPEDSNRSRGVGFRLTYVLPQWMLGLILNLSFAVGFSPGMETRPRLEVTPVVPRNAAIFQFIEVDDMPQLQKEFASGAWSPKVRDTGG